MEISRCPNCKRFGTVREIVWGMPDGPVDENKYLLGGCCISPDGIDPTHECIKCGWQKFTSRAPYEDYPPKFLKSVENSIGEKADIEFNFEQ